VGRRRLVWSEPLANDSARGVVDVDIDIAATILRVGHDMPNALSQENERSIPSCEDGLRPGPPLLLRNCLSNPNRLCLRHPSVTRTGRQDPHRPVRKETRRAGV
jgi:hypothetical protein